MKNLVIIFLMVTSFCFAQKGDNISVVQNGDIYEVTYTYADGTLKETGFFNAEGKLHGTWKNYDVNGNKVSTGTYENGKKTGKWLFFSEDKLVEVDYKGYKVQNVSEWVGRTRLAIND